MFEVEAGQVFDVVVNNVDRMQVVETHSHGKQVPVRNPRIVVAIFKHDSSG